MCEFLSWKVGPDGHCYFLTDKDVYSSHGRDTLGGCQDNDFIGHGAINAFYNGKTVTFTTEGENKAFWRPANYPKAIAEYLQSPETVLDTWGRMLKSSLQPDDAYYILSNAPKRWRIAFMELCLPVIAKSVYYVPETLRDVSELNPAQRQLLVKAVIENDDDESAYETLSHVKNLTPAQRQSLVRKVAKDVNYIPETTRDAKGLTVKQRQLLVRAVVKNLQYAYETLLNDVKRLTQAQRQFLVRAVAKDPVYAYRTLMNVKRLTLKQKDLLRKAS